MPICTMHDTIENGVYPYRCDECGECFLCKHTLTHGRRYWRCGSDPEMVPTTYSPGVPVSTAGPSGTAEPEPPKGITQYLKDLFYPAVKAKVDEFTQ